MEEEVGGFDSFAFLIFVSYVCAMCVYTITVGLQSTPGDPTYEMGGNRKKKENSKRAKKL
jgi:hypothetical protein